MPATPAPQLAAVQYPVLNNLLQTDRLNRGMLSRRPSNGMSPHLLMGKYHGVLGYGTPSHRIHNLRPELHHPVHGGAHHQLCPVGLEVHSKR